jgi:hypothetical protein
MNYLKWWLVLAVCKAAAFVLVPVCLVIVAVTKPVMAALDHAHLRLQGLRLRAGRTR